MNYLFSMFCSILFLGISIWSLYNAPIDQIKDLVKYSAAFGIVMVVFWAYEIKPKEEEKRKRKEEKTEERKKIYKKIREQVINEIIKENEKEKEKEKEKR